jgi:Na+-driven multidrug efflux pump
VLGFWTPLKGNGIWIGLSTGLGVVAVLMTWRWVARERLGLTRGKIPFRNTTRAAVPMVGPGVVP